jgi:hypothetical protein
MKKCVITDVGINTAHLQKYDLEGILPSVI